MLDVTTTLITAEPPKSYNFSLVNAFAGTPFGGNPAAVLFLDAPLADEALYLKIAQNFNQPMACFIFPIDDTESEPEPEPFESTKTFQIRWFTVTKESEICGHGTLAAAHALIVQSVLITSLVHVIRFKAMHGYVIARRIQASDAPDRIEIELPAFDVKPVEDKEFRRVQMVVSKAFHREVNLNYIGVARSGEGGFEEYLLIELNGKEVLDGGDVDESVFAETTPYSTNILTKRSQQPGIAYETRMFAPLFGIPEDPVCGSANCLMAPYWANKLSIASKGEMVGRQVSPRGGTLRVSVDRESGKVHLQGEACLTASGQFYL